MHFFGESKKRQAYECVLIFRGSLRGSVSVDSWYKMRSCGVNNSGERQTYDFLSFDGQSRDI